MFNVIDGANWTWWNIGGWDNSRHAVEACVHGRKSTLGATVSGRIDNNRWYDVRIVLKGRRVRCYLDEVLIHDVNYPAQTPAPSSG
jgi:hypothetical protein